MIRNIYVILTTLAILTTMSIAIEGYGVEGEDYSVGEVLFKVNEGINLIGPRINISGNIETGYEEYR